jgi:putative N6-adenine-specific DNA methylase
MKWKDFDKGIYESVKKELSSFRKDFNGKIICSDKNNKAVRSAKSNARKAKIGDLISFHNNDFFTSDFKINSGTLITNPPYGERLKEENLFEFYKNIGDTLKQKYKGIDAWILSSNKESMKKIGLRTSRRLKLFNGALECKYHNYQLYEGSKKKKYE